MANGTNYDNLNRGRPQRFTANDMNTNANTNAHDTAARNPRAAVERPEPAAAILKFVVIGCLIVLVVFVLALLVLGGTYIWFTRDLPPPERLGQTTLNQSTKIYDRNGDLLFEVFDPQGGKRTLVKPEQVYKPNCPRDLLMGMGVALTG